MLDNRYEMNISLNVLNHLGLSLYSNTPAVLAEVIANAWDADATEVRVDFNIEEKTITVSDNGCGMNLEDINHKYLLVGYEKRDKSNANFRTPGGRKPMGRKGIGKLSLFSIAKKVFVYSRKGGGEEEAFLMDSDKIQEEIQSENSSSSPKYKPEQVKFDVTIATHGTVIKITDLKKLRLTQAAISGLKKRIARRFSIIDPSIRFCIHVNDEEVTFSDRDYFHKARFLFQYGAHDYTQYCKNLDEDDAGNEMQSTRLCRFNADGVADKDGEHEISGWIAIARHSNDLDDKAQDDNLNKITVAMRGKVAQEDILQEYRLGGMITKYMYGEIHADFLDEDDKEDIATSSRQNISEDDSRYRALKSFIGTELKHIWTETNKLKEKKGIETALSSNPYIKEWHGKLDPALRKFAKKIFVDIDQAGIDEAHKPDFYANGILAFESLKMKNSLEVLNNIDISNLDKFLNFLTNIDDIEAARYHEIVSGRLTVIKAFREQVETNVLEGVLQKYIFGHLWLLDPAWERATEHAEMEKNLQKVVARVPVENEKVRLDITYKRIASAHIIIELKRPDRTLAKTEIESQVRKYIDALRHELNQLNNQDRNLPIEAFCIIGKLPTSWNNPEERKKDEESLRPYSIRIITYKELITNAYSAYSKFIKASESTGELRKLIDKIRNYKP